MNNKYKCLVKGLEISVNHIFKNFLCDTSLIEIFETDKNLFRHRVAIEIEGDLEGEILLSFPDKTLCNITGTMNSIDPSTVEDQHKVDISGEIANLISGTFANQLQYMNQNIRFSTPEFNHDFIEVKTFYENISLSFNSNFGDFDVDLYYQ